MFRADAHAHLFEPPGAPLLGGSANDVEHYQGLRDAHAIARTLVVGYEGMSWAEGNNAFLRSVARGHSWAAPVAYQRCDRPPTPEVLNEALGQGFVGISLYIESAADAAALARWPASTLEALAETRAIVSLNVAVHHIGQLRGFFEALDTASVMISHLGLPGRPSTWPAGDGVAAIRPLLEAACHPGLGVKVSGLYAVSDPPHAYPHRDAWPLIEAVKNAFGPERLFWGSDFPSAFQALSFAQTVDVLDHLDWPEADVTAVMGANLLRALDSVRR